MRICLKPESFRNALDNCATRGNDMELKWMDFNLLEFLSPNAIKVAITITLLILSSVLYAPTIQAGEGITSYSYERLGVPFALFALYSNADLIKGNELNDLNKMFAFGIVGNLVFWYLVSCLGMYAFGRLTGKGKLGEVQ